VTTSIRLATLGVYDGVDRLNVKEPEGSCSQLAITR